MKKVIGYALLSLLFVNLTNSQTIYKVELEKNLDTPFPEVLNVLLDAYQQGEIKAYYPKDISKPIAFVDFLQHFNIPIPEVNTDSDSRINCDESILKYNLDPWMKSCLTTTVEVVDTAYLGNNISNTTVHPNYVRLLFSSNCNYYSFDTYGPVFKWDEIKTLKTKIPNPKNMAVKYLPRDVLTLRLYRASFWYDGSSWQLYEEHSNQSPTKQQVEEMEKWSH